MTASRPACAFQEHATFKRVPVFRSIAAVAKSSTSLEWSTKRRPSRNSLDEMLSISGKWFLEKDRDPALQCSCGLFGVQGAGCSDNYSVDVGAEHLVK